MSTDEKLEERKFIVECIKLYENLPALWNMKCKDYSDRDIKNKQYEILLKKYKQRYLSADKTELKKKFNSLRTNFRKELKKIGDSKNGVHTEEPTLWYFDQMKFLINIDGACSSQNSISDGELYEQEAAELKRQFCDESRDHLFNISFNSPQQLTRTFNKSGIKN